MKTINKITMLMVLAGTLAVTAVNAQSGEGRGQGRGDRQGHGPHRGFGPDSCRLQLMIDNVAEELELSEAQEVKLLQLHYDHMAELKELRKKDRECNCVADRDARMASRDELNADIRKLLGDDKYIEFLEDKQDHRREHKQKGKRQQPRGKRPQRG